MRRLIEQIMYAAVPPETCRRLAELSCREMFTGELNYTNYIMLVLIAAAIVGTDVERLAQYTSADRDWLAEIRSNLFKCRIWSRSGCKYKWRSQLDALVAVAAALGLMESRAGRLIPSERMMKKFQSQSEFEGYFDFAVAQMWKKIQARQNRR